MSAKRAILLVSFGTSYNETRKLTLNVIETQVRETYPEWAVYHAWASHKIHKKMLERDGAAVPGPKETMEQVLADGITEMAVQPTLMMEGFEYGWLLEDIESMRESFDKICVGLPVLSPLADGERVIEIVAGELSLGEDEALVMMGHGSKSSGNDIYRQLNESLAEDGCCNIHIGTVEGTPTFEDVLAETDKAHPRRVVLAPLLMVAGDHAQNELGGDEKDSWKSRFEAAGYNTDCVLKGLGEYPGVREIIMEHLQAAIDGLDG